MESQGSDSVSATICPCPATLTVNVMAGFSTRNLATAKRSIAALIGRLNVFVSVACDSGSAASFAYCNVLGLYVKHTVAQLNNEARIWVLSSVNLVLAFQSAG